MAVEAVVVVETLPPAEQPCLVAAEGAARHVHIACIRHPRLAPLNRTAWPLLERLERLEQVLAAAMAGRAAIARLAVT